MPETLTAVYRDGAFVPEQEITMSPGARVRIVIQDVTPPAHTAAEALANHVPPTAEELAEFNELCDRTSVSVGKEHHMTRDELHERG